MLTDTLISKNRKAFANGSSANVKFSKTQLSKIQSGGSIFYMPCPKKILSKIANKAEDLSDKLTLNDVIKTVGISKNLIKDLKKNFGTGTTLRNNEIKDLMKIIKSLEN